MIFFNNYIRSLQFGPLQALKRYIYEDKKMYYVKDI